MKLWKKSTLFEISYIPTFYVPCISNPYARPHLLSITHHISTGFCRYLLWLFGLIGIDCGLSVSQRWVCGPAGCADYEHDCHCLFPATRVITAQDVCVSLRWLTTSDTLLTYCSLSVLRCCLSVVSLSDCMWGFYSEVWSATSHLCRTLSPQHETLGVLFYKDDCKTFAKTVI